MEREKPILHAEEIDEFMQNGGYEKMVLKLETIIQKYKFSGVKPEAKEILSDIKFKVLEGKRTWDKFRFPKIENYIFYGAISTLKNYVKKESRCESINSEWETIDDDDYCASNGRYLTASDNDYLSDLVYEERRTAIYDLLKDDDDAGIVLLQLENGFKISQIADDLGVEINFVRNALKRIKRKSEAYLKSNIEK